MSGPRRSYLPLTLEWVAVGIARLLYRVRSSGAEQVPPAGGALLIANHLSYVDVVALQLTCPRPLRFVGYRGLKASAAFDWIFRQAGVIAVSGRHPVSGQRRSIEALKAGEVVCVFPEGGISRTGQLMGIKRGFEVMAREAGVPVIPAAVDGLWGSIFSYAGQRYLWKWPRIRPTDVFVAYGRPLDPVNAVAARRALLDLGAQAFAERPTLRRHLGREVVRALTKKPGRVVVVDRTQERRPLRAAQLFGAAAVLARRLRATVPEGRVGIVLPPGAGAFIANLAVLCAGKSPVNLNFTVGRDSIEANMRLAGIGTVISADAMRARLPDFPWPERTIDLRSALAAAGGRRAILPWVLAAWLVPNQWAASLVGLPRHGDRTEAALLFTSGSGGQPKGVVLTHRNLLANCAQVSSLSILPRDCTMLGSLPVFHSFGFTVTLWYPLLRGCGLVTVPSPLDTRRMVDAIRDEAVTVLVGAPTFLRPMLRKARPDELRSLQLVVTGAEKLPDDLARAFRESFNLEILQGYGMTEASPVTNVNQPDPDLATATADPQEGKRAGTVGRLLPGMTARILDPEGGSELAPGETGMVCLRGENVFAGYLGEETAVKTDGWHVTGDLGYFDDEGFLTIAGRLSRFSKIGGEMVPHGTIEEKLIELFGLELAEGPVVAVAGVPDAAKGEALVLIAAVDLSVDQVRDRLAAAGLPNLWIPRRVLRVEKVPLLGTGKLDLEACRRLARA